MDWRWSTRSGVVGADRNDARRICSVSFEACDTFLRTAAGTVDAAFLPDAGRLSGSSSTVVGVLAPFGRVPWLEIRTTSAG